MKVPLDNPGVLGVSKSPAMQRRLLKYLEGGRIHPGLLLTGGEPDTKLGVAKGMAKYLLCHHRKKNAAGAVGSDAFCGKCTACDRIDKEIHPDLLLIREVEEDSIKIETIRELSYQMGIVPLEGSRKICIIEDCHRMNPAASNAFLKTLEEPGEGRFFILITSQPGALLSTLLSRVIQFHFRPEGESYALSGEDIPVMKEVLERFFASKDVGEFSSFAEDRAKALRFLQYLQIELHEAALKNEASPFSNLPDLAITFDKVVEVEGKLRSNASSGLLVENLMRQHFS